MIADTPCRTLVYTRHMYGLCCPIAPSGVYKLQTLATSNSYDVRTLAIDQCHLRFSPGAGVLLRVHLYVANALPAITVRRNLH